MREFFINNRKFLVIASVVILLLGVSFLIMNCNDQFRPDKDSDFANYTFVPDNNGSGKIWEVRTKRESVSFNPDEYHIYINIIDPENGKRVETIQEEPRKVYESDIYLYYVDGKVWLISSSSDCLMINVYDAGTFEKLMDIDQFEDTHEGLQLGIEEITIDKDFDLHFKSAEKSYLYKIVKDTIYSSGEPEYGNRRTFTDTVFNDGYIAKNNFIFHRPDNEKNKKIIDSFFKNSPDSFSQLIYHDNSQAVIFQKNPGQNYSIICNNNKGVLKWEIKQEEFEDIIEENNDIRVLSLPYGSGKLVFDFRKPESGYSKETFSTLGMIGVSVDTGEILWDWKVEKEIK
jgi:hypothetical protein